MSPRTAKYLSIACSVLAIFASVIFLVVIIFNYVVLSQPPFGPYALGMAVGLVIAMISQKAYRNISHNIEIIPAGIALITNDKKIVTDYSKKRTVWKSDIARLGLWKLEIIDQDIFITFTFETPSPNTKTLCFSFKLRVEFKKHAHARDAFIAACKNTNEPLHVKVRATALLPITEFCEHHTSELSAFTLHSSHKQQLAFSNLCVKALRPKLFHVGIELGECTFQIR